MSEYNEMVQFLKAKRPTCITKYPTGRFGLVGSIPIQLTRPSTSYTSPDPVSMVWDKEEDVIAALLSIGVEQFQKSDCSWYGR